jgi:hypothetical protein
MDDLVVRLAGSSRRWSWWRVLHADVPVARKKRPYMLPGKQFREEAV